MGLTIEWIQKIAHALDVGISDLLPHDGANGFDETAASAATISYTPAERLRSARRKAGYKSAVNASTEFGWTASAYRHHENGTRPFDVAQARQYGKAFGVDPTWLLQLAESGLAKNGREPERKADVIDLAALAPADRLAMLTLYHSLIRRKP